MAKAKRKQTVVRIKPLIAYPHQRDVTVAWNTGKKDRFFLNWHRRAGKDITGLEFARERMEERTGTYWHLFPFHVQAKRAIWNGIDARDGVKFIDRAFPPDQRDAINQTEMSIDWKGSHWQMLGSDNYDRMVGSNPCGIIFSEWALCDPAAWEYIRPILIENKGWAMFITTFRGRNHAYRMFKSVQELENWYVDTRTILDTVKNDGTPIVSQEDIAKEMQAGMSESLIQQEFYCNPDAASSGTIFNRQHIRLVNEHVHAYERNSLAIRIAWGLHNESIAGVAFQGKQIIAVHTFNESNIVDCIQTVARRHPHTSIIHHAESVDGSVYSDSDGAGFVSAFVAADENIRHGLAAHLLNNCTVTAIAKERLCDFAMSFAPYRQTNDDTDISNYAICKALAVMRSAQPIYSNKLPAQPLRYASDRGVI